jgi:hypothetical protein
MLVVAVIELKPKNMAKAVRQIDKKGKDATFQAKQNVGQNPHKIKVRPRGESMKEEPNNVWKCVDKILNKF